MARLTKLIKEQIVANAITKSGILNREAKNIKARAKLADKCRIESLGGKAKLNKMVKAAALAKEATDAVKSISDNNTGDFRATFNRQIQITVAFGGMQDTLQYNGNTLPTKETDKRVYLTPAPFGHYRSLTVPADHTLTKEWDAINAEQKIINDIRDNISVNTWAILESVTTDKKLIEIWPESFELIPKSVASPTINLPTTDVKTLNDMIGIPSDKK